MNICLIRHGETDWNASGRLQGREDIPLNENGMLQAAQCALALKSREWRAIFTSPLKRARQTANILAGILNIPELYEDAGLMERDYGKASGLLPEERAARFPDGNWEGVEDWDALRDRACGAITSIAERFPDGDVIVVTHGGVINSILAELSNCEIGSGKTRLKNACVSMLEYRDKAMRIVFYNKTVEDLVWRE